MAKRPAKRIGRATDLKKLGLQGDADTMIAYLEGELDGVELPAKLVEKIERLQTTRAMLIQHIYIDKVVKMLTKTFNYSVMSAHRDIKLAAQVFGPISLVNTQMRRVMAEQMIKEDRKVARTKEDAKAMAQSTKNYMELWGLNKEDQEMPDFTDFEGHTYVMGIFPEQVGVKVVQDDAAHLEKIRGFVVDAEIIEAEEDE